MGHSIVQKKENVSHCATDVMVLLTVWMDSMRSPVPVRARNLLHIYTCVVPLDTGILLHWYCSVVNECLF